MNWIVLIQKCCLIQQIIMGCGTSIAQVSDSSKEGFKPIRLLDLDKEKESGEIEGKIYLFGQTRTQRKIVELDLKSSSIKLLSNRVRIPVPRIQYDPIELMYEQSQQIFHLGVYGLSILPPFNKMLILYLQTNLIFLCGGKDFDSFNIKNESFYYTIHDDDKKTNEAQSVDRTEPRPKYSTNKFEKLGSMNGKRYGHMGLYAPRLKGVLIFGGVNDKQEIINSCELYVVMDNTWKQMPSMHLSRAFGNCFQFNSKVYVFGGKNSATKRTKKIEAFDCETLQWEVLNFKIHRGIQQAFITSPNPNQILIVGGKTNAGPTKSVIKVDLSSQSFIWDSSLNYQYPSVKGMRTKSNTIVMGGLKDTIEAYINGQWSAKGFDFKKCLQHQQMQLFSFSSQSLHVAVEAGNRQPPATISPEDLILFGNDEYPCLLRCNLKAATIQKQSISMKFKIRSKMAVVQYQKSKYFLCGGRDWKEKRPFNSAYFYHADKNQFKETFKMNEKKYDFAICALEGYIYTFGGYDSLEKVSKKTCAKFNLENQSWENLPTLRRARRNCFSQVINSKKIAIFGGAHGNQAVAGIEIFNVGERKFDIYQPGLELPQNILCSYCQQNNQTQIFIVNRTSSLGYQLTSVSLQSGPVHSNRSSLSNKIGMDLSKSLEKKQLLKDVLAQRSEREAYAPEYLKEQVSYTNMIKVKPQFIEIKPKFLQSQSLQANQNNNNDELDSSFELKRIQLNVNQPPPLQIQQIQQRLDKIEGSVPVVVQGTAKQEVPKVVQQKSIEEQVPVISCKPIDWLSKDQYLVANRLDHIYFITDSSCLQFHKNSEAKKFIKLENRSNVTMRMIQ